MSEGAVKIKKRRKKDRFTQLSNKVLRDRRMSLAVRGLFALMFSLPEDDEHPVSYYTKAGGISKETFGRYVKELEKYGYLTREQTHLDGGRFGVNVYTLDDEPCTTFPCTEKPCTEKPCTEKPCTEKPCTENPCTDKYSLGLNIPPISPQGEACVDFFDRFWTLYPRKQGKKKARQAWDKLAPDKALCAKMSAALKAQMRSEEWTRDGGRYIPYPATWLNQARWEDEILPAAAAPQWEAPVREEDQWIT